MISSLNKASNLPEAFLFALNSSANSSSTSTITFIDRDREETLTFQELYHNALGLLGVWQQEGIVKDSEIIILVESNRQFLEAFWACVMGRMKAIPLMVGNVDKQRKKIWRVLEKLQSPVIYTSSQQWSRLMALQEQQPWIEKISKKIQKILRLDRVTSLSTPGVVATIHADDIAFIQFSSGATSAPKGVVLTHRNLLTNIAAIHHGTGSCVEDLALSWMPLTHDMGLIGFHLAPLLGGISHTLMNTEVFVRYPLRWLQELSERKITITASPNFGYQHCLKRFDVEHAKEIALDLSSVRLIFNGAEPIHFAICEQFVKTLQPLGLQEHVLFPVYGLAEASLAVTFSQPNTALEKFSYQQRILVSVGKPVQSCQVRIVDDENNICVEHQVGRIQISGDNVTSGYYQSAELTTAVINTEGWLDTGDLGFIVNEQLYITGRRKEMMILHGINYYPEDIEQALERTLNLEPGRVAVGALFPCEDAITESCVIFILYKKSLVEFIELLKTVRQFLSKEMGISSHCILPIKQFPKTTSGKIQRFKLIDQYQQGEWQKTEMEIKELLIQEKGIKDAELFEKKMCSADDEYLQRIEKQLLMICQEVVPNIEIGREDNLFDFVTSSLTLAQMYEKIEAAFPNQIEVTDLFDNPTVGSMAVFLKNTASKAGVFLT